MAKQSLIVVGGGLAGLMATIKSAEAGVPVQLFSLVPVKRSHSVCAQGGINGAVNTKGEGDSPWEHFDDTVYGGDFLANQPPVKAMCEAAPGIIHLMDRMGVMFNRTPEGLLDFRRFGGTKHHRTAFAGATTGQQLLYALDEQVRRHEAAGLVTKYENWEFLSVVLDDEGVCRGITAQNLRTMEITTFPSDAVILATGGPGDYFRQNDELGHQHGDGGQCRVPARRNVRERRVHSDSPDGDSGRRQAAANVGISTRGRRTDLDVQGRQTVVLPRGEIPGLRQPRAAGHRDSGDFPCVRRHEAGH
ncbi:hypothetical protein HMSSN139_11820 [Paenibacillus sp. HMSSN-139]|nr:hypothetical protein HMSSN139_11820 [Paenibacillus sp. HMSSN-139]